MNNETAAEEQLSPTVTFLSEASRKTTEARSGTVLVVDDVRDYCEEIAFALSRDGYRVLIATSGREAILAGTVARPDVLVTDWMLKDHVHGLDVAEALQLVSPTMQTILITGFASEDLRVDARVAEVFQFIEKPFPIEDIRKSVRAARQATRPWTHQMLIGFLEVNRSRSIVYANPAARELFGRTITGEDSGNLDEIFNSDQLLSLYVANEQWVEAFPMSPKLCTWSVRGRELQNGNTIYVLLDERHKAYRCSALVNRLLGLKENLPKELQLEGHILVVDDYEAVRRLAVDVLRHFNCVCHTAQTHEEAIRLFAHDVDIKTVILDFEMQSSDPVELVNRLRDLRPGVRIIGTSVKENRAAFAAMGVKYFLAKPWEVNQLLEILSASAG